jgi:hypothetical protein
MSFEAFMKTPEPNSTPHPIFAPPKYWQAHTGIIIIDPDGWRSSAGDLPPKGFEEVITLAEFTVRALHSTCTGSKASQDWLKMQPAPSEPEPHKQPLCDHTGEGQVKVSAELSKIINADQPDKILGYQLLVSAKCGKCGLPFHFPGFAPMSGMQAPRVSRDATCLLLDVVPGPGVAWSLQGPPQHNPALN